jgi:hypothetical protein
MCDCSSQLRQEGRISEEHSSGTRWKKENESMEDGKKRERQWRGRSEGAAREVSI